MTTRALWAASLVVAVGGACSGDDGAGPGSTAVSTVSAGPTVPTTGSTERTASTLPAPTTAPVATTTAVTTTEPATTCRLLALGVNEVELRAGGAVHQVRIYVPSGFAGEPLPTVLNWHGLGSDGPQQAVFTGYEALAAAEGFIVVHPTGVPSPGTDVNSWELADDQDPGRDDIAFANALIDTLIDDWCADPRRIYSTGMSNGGYFTARLLCEIADRIAAASSVAGTFHPDGCAPVRPVPYLAFHGTDDLVVPFDGSGESVLVSGDDPALRAFFSQVMPDEFGEFAADAGCRRRPKRSTVGTDVLRHRYVNCDGDGSLVFFEITGGGHTWPSSPLADQVSALGYTTDDVDATADSWAFFEGYTLDD